MTHVTTWDEERVLDYFWAVVRDDGDRLELLKQLADVALERPSDWDLGAIRVAFAGVRQTLMAEACFCCKTTERRLYWHHVIQVQHGGSNTPRNVVGICHACHRRIHPWLEPPTSYENKRGWTAVRDIVLRASSALDRAFGEERARIRRDQTEWP